MYVMSFVATNIGLQSDRCRSDVEGTAHDLHHNRKPKDGVTGRAPELPFQLFYKGAVLEFPTFALGKLKR